MDENERLRRLQESLGVTPQANQSFMPDDYSHSHVETWTTPATSTTPEVSHLKYLDEETKKGS